MTQFTEEPAKSDRDNLWDERQTFESEYQCSLGCRPAASFRSLAKGGLGGGLGGWT
jgi:hypothetical protein